MTINSTAIVLLSLLVAVAKQHGVDPAALRGTVQNDMLKEFVARGTYRLPVASVAAARRRRDRVRDAEHAEVEPDLDLGLPHARGGLRRPSRRSPSRSPTAIAYVEAARDARPRRRRTSPGGSRSSSTRTTTSSRRSRSSAPRAACGRGSCASASTRRTARSRTLRFHTQTAGSTLQAAADRRERRPRHPAGARRGPRRDAVAPHEQPRRGPRRCRREAAARARAAHAAGHRPRVAAWPT